MYNGVGIKKLHKECFITTGASARFPELVVAALQPDALESFARQGFTKLTFQVGDALDLFHRAKPKLADCMGLEIEAFDFNATGLDKELKACLAVEGKSAEGMVITHAGT
jgi:beta-1,4-N-acetylglucosaminyltransferase